MKRSPLNKQGKETKKWLAFRRQYLKKHMNWKNEWDCEICGMSTAYPEVDHKAKRSTDPEIKYDENNLQILCGGLYGCHNKETARKP